MKHLIILFLLLNICSAQNNNISGMIYNSEDNSPLEFVNISIEGKSIGTISDKNGEFELKGNFGQEDKIIFSFIGFEKLILPINQIPDKQNLIIKLIKKVLSSQSVLVTGSIGKQGETPITFSKITRKDIEENYNLQDIPEYLSYLPSTTFYSEGGSGLGYNYLSIRGFDQRRISISINGIPQNEPEDHNMYWLDLPDLLASSEYIQVQRGSGSGVIGYPAVGGSINIITSSFSNKQMVDVGISAGSYNTRKYNATVSSGLIDNKYSIYANFSQMLSTGYRKFNWIDFKSYHLSAIRFDENFTTQINIYGGPVADGLVYNGLPKFAVKDKKRRKENYSYWQADENKYSDSVYRRTDEIENFSQPHFEILNEYKMGENVTFNSALFLIIGKGFFDYNGSWTSWENDYFRLKENEYLPQDGVVPGNALIRAQVENNQWGWIPRISFTHTGGTLILGGEMRFHKSLHWGEINYAENLPVGITKNYKYYQYNAKKDILSFFANESYTINDKLSLLGEFQISYHKYRLYNEKYVNTDFAVSHLFFNPRIGVNYKFNNESSIYLSAARVSREPRLKNYYDAAESSYGEVPEFEVNADGSYNFDKPLVKPETMNNAELGFNFNNEIFNVTANVYFSLFNNEIVKNGQLDRFGQPKTGNMKRTIHEGIEVSAVYKVNEYLEIMANGTYSKNFISKGVAYIEDTISIKELDLSGNRISGFPDLMANLVIKLNYEGFNLQIANKFVGDFYSDNYDKNLKEYLVKYPGFNNYSDNQVDAYFTTNIFAGYEFGLNPVFKKVKIFAQVNNLFDNLYAAYAVGKEFYPAAERNFLMGINVGL
ncbi:MAG: TonB-dependent receptor [Ignavibacteria bacterium]|nr:TonB-dependent receptor [Ignavibacteria bacterium]